MALAKLDVQGTCAEPSACEATTQHDGRQGGKRAQRCRRAKLTSADLAFATAAWATSRVSAADAATHMEKTASWVSMAGSSAEEGVGRAVFLRKFTGSWPCHPDEGRTLHDSTGTYSTQHVYATLRETLVRGWF